MKNIAKGDYLRDITKSNALAPHGFTLKDAFLKATVHKCYRCQAWAQFLHVFTFRKLCWDCFDHAMKSNDPAFALITKTKVKEQVGG